MPLVVLDWDSGRCWVLSGNGGKIRASADGPWLIDFPMPMPMPDDVAANFAAVSGKEAESLAMSAAAAGRTQR